MFNSKVLWVRSHLALGVHEETRLGFWRSQIARIEVYALTNRLRLALRAELSPV